MKKKIIIDKIGIIRYLIGKDKTLECYIILRDSPNIELYTTDQDLYEALVSFPERDKIDINRLIKFIERVNIISYKYAFNKKRFKINEYKKIKLFRLALGGDTYE